MKWLIRPCVNGSSIEIEMDEKDFSGKSPALAKDSIIKDEFMKWYGFLKEICDVMTPIEKEKIRYNSAGEPLPSNRQYELMSNFNIPFDQSTTRAQATQLLKDSYEKAKRESKK